MPDFFFNKKKQELLFSVWTGNLNHAEQQRMSDDGVHGCMTAWDINRLCLLGISFFQKSAPELVLSERLCENQLVVAGGNAVVHDDIDPLAITPELSVETKEKM